MSTPAILITRFLNAFSYPLLTIVWIRIYFASTISVTVFTLYSIFIKPLIDNAALVAKQTSIFGSQSQCSVNLSWNFHFLPPFYGSMPLLQNAVVHTCPLQENIFDTPHKMFFAPEALLCLRSMGSF
jgi:hypothetical protein